MSANSDRSDDLAWMADWHETPRGAARRLGISVRTLRRWCERYDPEVWERLRRNESLRQGAA